MLDNTTESISKVCKTGSIDQDDLRLGIFTPWAVATCNLTQIDTGPVAGIDVSQFIQVCMRVCVWGCVSVTVTMTVSNLSMF